MKKSTLAFLFAVLSWNAPARADGVFAFGVPSFGQPQTTVSALPTCNASTNGVIYTVTNALLPALAGIVAGGGAVTVLVHCNGTNWVVG